MSGPLDFTSTEQLLFFNETVVSHDIEVLIINDGIPELSEYFLAVLSLLDPLLPPSKILISPAVANITIVDGMSTIVNRITIKLMRCKNLKCC